MEPDTIVALSTPPGRGALAVIRVSGSGTACVLRRLAPGGPDPFPARRPVLVRLRDPDGGDLLDRALVTYFPAPASYTGEDVAELSVHGGALLSASVVEACQGAGAREAEPGEFTRRAYLNGKLDLVQAEAVADLIDAESPAFRRAAVHQVEGGLSSRLASLREGLVALEALLVHHIDFPDEDEPPVPIVRVRERADAIARELAGLLATAPEGELLREGATVVLAGRPNTGKSSLYNALLGEERAIVTDTPGTTRDALEARVSIGGYPFRLVDTAGLREEVGAIERMGIEVAWRHLERADVVLLCVPADERPGSPERGFLARLGEERPVLVLRTCADRVEAGAEGSEGELGGAIECADGSAETGEREGASDAGPAGREEDGETSRLGAVRASVRTGERLELRVSARTGEGLERLRERLRDLVFSGVARLAVDAPVVTRRRQRRSLTEALEEVRSFGNALERGVPAEAAAAHLHSAETALEEVLGVISPEEVLDRVFSDFCIGK